MILYVSDSIFGATSLKVESQRHKVEFIGTGEKDRQTDRQMNVLKVWHTPPISSTASYPKVDKRQMDRVVTIYMAPAFSRGALNRGNMVPIFDMALHARHDV